MKVFWSCCEKPVRLCVQVPRGLWSTSPMDFCCCCSSSCCSSPGSNVSHLNVKPAGSQRPHCSSSAQQTHSLDFTVSQLHQEVLDVKAHLARPSHGGAAHAAGSDLTRRTPVFPLQRVFPHVASVALVRV